MQRALFVSDIHIASPDDPKCRQFLRFLDQCRTNRPEHLFLVGDIFDLWVADRHYFTERYHEVVARIRELGALGVQVHYFEGNHDLDLRRYWEEHIGARVYESAEYFDLYGHRVRVEHGDQMDPEDRGYLFLRWLLRTRFVRFLGRHLPNALVRWIGERASRASRDYTSNVKTTSDDRAREKIRRHAEIVYDEKPFDILVAGHVHVNEDVKLENGARVFNLGTWLKRPMVLMLAPQSLMLIPVDGTFGR